MFSDNTDDLKTIKKTLIDIDDRLYRIETILYQHIHPKCDKMEKHINFVDNVYVTIKKPLQFICNLTNKHTLTNGEQQQALPFKEIEK